MKTNKIIQKNIKLLTRSRTSTLVLIFGPLLVIVLVGMSFSTSSFHLNIGTFSEAYSELSNSFVDKLISEGYSLTRYESEELCIESVKEGQSHACIVFPADLAIENEKSNIIKFHVDQSQVNLVYLVMSTLTGSFGEKTSEISKDLTSTIVTTLFDTKNELDDTDTLISEILSKNTDLTTKSEESITSLEDLDFDAGSVEDVDSAVSDVKLKLNDLRDDSIELIEDGLDIVDDLEDYDVDPNQTADFEDDLDDMTDTLNDLNSTIKSKHNQTASELNDLVVKVTETFDELSEKLDEAGNANEDVITKLNNIKNNADELKEKSDELNNKIKDLISKINAVQVTNIENIVTPIKTEINPVVKEQSNLGFLFPSLIVMLIMFIGLLLPSTLIIMEKNSRAYFRVFTTPTKNWLFVMATFLTSMIMIFFQITIILTVSQFYFKINFLQSFFILFLSLVIIMTFFILLGMLLGYIFNTEEMAMLASVSIGTLFLLTSGIIFPLESMPQYILGYAKMNPVVLGSELFKKSILFGSNFSSVKVPLGYLILFSLVLVGIIFLVKKAGRLQFMLKKPSRMKLKKDWLTKQFDFGERKAKTLPEFIVSIQNMSDEKFHGLLKQDAIKDWLILIHKNRYLATKIGDAKTRQSIVNVLVEELKRISEKKNKPKQ